MKKYKIGIDIGKTYTKIICMDNHNIILYKRSCNSILDSTDNLFNFLINLVQEIELQMSYKYESIGICFPGYVNYKKQEVNYIPTFPNISVLSSHDIANVLMINVEKLIIDNDCNAASFGEYKLGNLKNSNNAILLSFGTGIGASIIIDGKLYRGTCGLSGEIGHSIFINGKKKCKCGNIGCYETLKPNYEAIFKRDNQYNKLFTKNTKTFFEAMGNLLGTIINLLNIECVALFGHQFSNKSFKSQLIDYVSKYTLNEHFKACSFVDCKLGNWAGAIGMISMCNQKGQKK